MITVIFLKIHLVMHMFELLNSHVSGLGRCVLCHQAATGYASPCSPTGGDKCAVLTVYYDLGHPYA